MVVLWTQRHVMQLSLQGPREPHRAISAVSKSHCVANVTRVYQHNMPLHVLFQTTQICQKQVMGTHQITHFQHDRTELFVVPGNRGPLPQVKQPRLVVQGMVEITEFSFQCMAEILP